MLYVLFLLMRCVLYNTRLILRKGAIHIIYTLTHFVYNSKHIHNCTPECALNITTDYCFACDMYAVRGTT